MMHEKRGVIEPGRTPPEDEQTKTASVEELEQHPATRAAKAVQQGFEGEDANDVIGK